MWLNLYITSTFKNVEFRSIRNICSNYKDLFLSLLSSTQIPVLPKPETQNGQPEDTVAIRTSELNNLLQTTNQAFQSDLRLSTLKIR